MNSCVHQIFLWEFIAIENWMKRPVQVDIQFTNHQFYPIHAADSLHRTIYRMTYAHSFHIRSIVLCGCFRFIINTISVIIIYCVLCIKFSFAFCPWMIYTELRFLVCLWFIWSVCCFVPLFFCMLSNDNRPFFNNLSKIFPASFFLPFQSHFNTQWLIFALFRSSSLFFSMSSKSNWSHIRY